MKSAVVRQCRTVAGRTHSRVILRIIPLILLGNFAPLTAQAAAGTDATTQPANDNAAEAEDEAQQLLDESLRAEGVEPALPQPALEGVVANEPESATPRRLRYHVSLSVRGVYDDNINLTPANRESDFYTTIEPTIDLGYGQPEGNFIALTYAPNAFLFVDHKENDAFQQIISLTGQYRFPLLTLNLFQDIQLLDGTGLNADTGTGIDFTRTNLDVAGRTKVNIYSTRLTANYSLTGKTFLTGALAYSLNDYQTLIDSSVFSGNIYFNYTYSPKLALGLGIAGGYNEVGAPSQNQVYEQLNARASYELTGKVSASLTAGVEFRQVTNGTGNDNASPVFDGNLFYQPFDGTSLSLSLSRRTQNSATLGGQDFYSTSIIVSARQRFLQRIFLGVAAGYEHTDYFSTVSGLSANRKDDYYFVQTSLDLSINSYWTAGIYYFYREDDSTINTFSFYDNQFGFRTSLNF